jgi:nitrous oxidase accessory protein NosD
MKRTAFALIMALRALRNIVLDSSVGNQIVGNNITGEDTGFGYCVHIENAAADNLIVGNNFVDAGVAVTIYGNSGGNNTFYHNNFINNSHNVGGWIEDEEANVCDNGEEGNFWSDYEGADADDDSIGDTPYLIDDVRPDRHPLMAPFSVSSVTVESPEWANPPDSEESSPILPVVFISVITVIAIGIGLLVYIRKRKR